MAVGSVLVGFPGWPTTLPPLFLWRGSCPGLFLASLWRVRWGVRPIPSPVEGEDHLQLAHPVDLHHKRPQLPLVCARQEPLGIRGDGKNVPEP